MTSPTLRRIGPIIFAVSWLVRIALVLIAGSWRQPVNAVEAVQVARSIAAGEGFSNPYNCVTGPTAHLAPVYPYLVSVIYRIFPPGGSRQLVRFILSITITSLAYALLPWLAWKLRLDTRVGIVAGLAGAAVPLFFWVEVVSEWEAPLTGLLLVIGLGLLADLFSAASQGRALAAGVAWGVALLTAPTLLPVFAALFAMLLWHGRQHLPATKHIVVGLLGPIFLLILPWTVRNYAVFHELILIRGNAGLQLHMSFNPLARTTFEEGSDSGAFADHPFTTLRVCEEVARSGEVAMNRKYQKEAVAWIRANPGRSVRLVAQRFVAFWRMAVPSEAKTAASELLTLLALVGLFFCFIRGALAGRILGIVLLIYPLPYYVNFFEVRYRYPLHAITVLLACVAVSEMINRLRQHPETRDCARTEWISRR